MNIVTLAEGDSTHLHIGFKGTMNALFLKELGEKPINSKWTQTEGAGLLGGEEAWSTPEV